MSVRASTQLWYCSDCTVKERPGSYPCRLCCGYTGRRAKVASGVRNAWGKPTLKVPS